MNDKVIAEGHIGVGMGILGVSYLRVLQNTFFMGVYASICNSFKWFFLG